DLRRIELYLVGGFRGFAVQRLDRVIAALLLERVLGIFVVGRGEGGRQPKADSGNSQKREPCSALQDQSPRRIDGFDRLIHHLLLGMQDAAHSVCRKSTTAL